MIALVGNEETLKLKSFPGLNFLVYLRARVVVPWACVI